VLHKDGETITFKFTTREKNVNSGRKTILSTFPKNTWMQHPLTINGILR